ncbi:dethiobiotin synthetase [Gramella sp. Hel_I_59]|uniref:dethiobiotin synthase n=1 Tax=Gramella sp. Hel_I_59 TaxID=1249978 RepID=UPI001153446B|nr:dethiobiotin synthase [Gramella sp. Hel_I_59]TQI72169.1 dethiobiotin synthetase [Gramella sp. Hel_I_59]
MPAHYFITGISTDVGKSIAAAMITEALEADYWKPVQAGDLDNSDAHKVERLVSNSRTTFHKNSYALNSPMSPHAAAEIDSVKIDLKKIKRPETNRDLVIEGAGGLLVPLNNKSTILDLIEKDDYVILVSRHYLGSINHTLLSIEMLKSRGIENIKIIFSGDEHQSTEQAILDHSGIEVLGRIEQEPYFDKNVVLEYAEKWKEKLCKK